MCQDWPISIKVKPSRKSVRIKGIYCQPIEGMCSPILATWADVKPPTWWERRQGLTWPQKVKAAFTTILETTTRERDLHRLQLLSVANMCKMAGVETITNRVLGAHVK